MSRFRTKGKSATKDIALIALGAASIFAVIVVVFGWALNLLALIGSAGDLKSMSDVTPLMALRAVGVFVAPLGAVLGYIL